jgi:uncharacterized membrane protein
MIGHKTANRAIFVLSLAGAGVSLYLTLAHKDYLSLICGPSSGCDEVAHHPSSRGFGVPGLESIPTAAFGLLMYVAIVAISFARVASTSEVIEKRASSLQWLLSLGGVLVSAWLTYLEAFVIHAWCKWCVASAIIILATFIISSAERFSGRAPTQSLTPEREVS